MRLALAALIVLALPAPAVAEGRETLGVGRIFSNDYLGDGHDRWRTGSFALSIVRGPADGRGALLEWRLRTEIVAPGSRSGPGPDDRPYAGSLSFGLHRHWRAGVGEVTAGADLVATGPRTGVGAFQEWFHEQVGAPRPRGLDRQVGDGVHLSGTLAHAVPLRMGDRVIVRPFAEVTAGVEDIARFGGDVILGRAGHDALWIRDVSSGQPYQGIEGMGTGLSLVAGADLGLVGDSLWLRDPEPQRLRAMAGVHWQIAPHTSFFYGVATLSPEFEGQDEGQVTEPLRLNSNF